MKNLLIPIVILLLVLAWGIKPYEADALRSPIPTPTEHLPPHLRTKTPTPIMPTAIPTFTPAPTHTPTHTPTPVSSIYVPMVIMEES